MSDQPGKTDWLKQLKKLLRSSERVDIDKLKGTLEKLKHKSKSLKDEIDQTEDPQKRTALIEHWEMVKKHRKKGIKKLKELNDH